MSKDNINASAQAMSVPSIAHGSEKHPTRHADRSVELPMDVSRWQNVYFLRVVDVLAKYQFLRQLEHEKRRTDRSKASLSIALFHLDSKKNDELGDAEALLNILRNTKRETDILGYLGHDLVALLLPDTDEEGTRGFMKKIANRIERLSPLTATGTYPDHLFDSLATKNQNQADLYPFFLDDSKDRKEGGYFLKRSLDIAGAAAGILLLSPLLIITAMAIAVDSPGPMIFKQIRLGRRGVPFVFYKFRSMFSTSDDRIHREFVTKLIKGKLEEINQGDAANPFYKLKSDPRVTRVGKFIRDTSIDELPQLFNVLKGDMSLVGPRPPLPYEAENYQAWHLRRILEAKPGITGLWQVDGHSTTSFDDMVRLDLRYTRSCSLILDLKIILKTVNAVLKCRGAKLGGVATPSGREQPGVPNRRAGFACMLPEFL